MRTRLLALLLVLAPLSAHAQSSAPGARELSRLLSDGHRVQIVDVTQSQIAGRFERVSESAIRVRVGRTVREIPLADVYQVRRERHEPDGIWIGLAIGAAAGLAYVSLQCRAAYSEREDCITVGRMWFVPPATVAGGLVDWSIRRFETIFQRSSPVRERVTIAPLLGRRQAGVAIRVGF